MRKSRPSLEVIKHAFLREQREKYLAQTYQFVLRRVLGIRQCDICKDVIIGEPMWTARILCYDRKYRYRICQDCAPSYQALQTLWLYQNSDAFDPKHPHFMHYDWKYISDQWSSYVQEIDYAETDPDYQKALRELDEESRI